jgi:ABC-2 type transport system permease protein
MKVFAQQSTQMALRDLRNLLRQPWYVALTLMGPMIWLLLYGALFKRIVEIPGFGGGNYIDYLAPGIVVMSAMMSGGWSGMGVIQDLERGVIDRFLIAPTRRGSMIAGRLAQQAVVTVVQSVIIVLVALALGAHFAGGVAGVAVLIALAVLLGSAFGALSNGIALLARREETVIAAVQFVQLPLTFLSSVFIAATLAPHWIRDIARVNPLEWAAAAGRSALAADVDWGLVASRAGYLAAFAIASAWFATRAFRAYQRAV